MAQWTEAVKLVWDWLGQLLTHSTFWTAVGALATVAAASGVYIALEQLRFEAWLKAQDIFVGQKFVKARERVFRHLHKPDLIWDIEDQDAGLEVCRRMDEFCRLTPYFAFRKSKARDIVLEVWDDPLGKSWALLEPLVMEERDIVGWNTKWSAFKEFGDAALNQLSEEKRAKLKNISSSLAPQITQLRRKQR